MLLMSGGAKKSGPGLVTVAEAVATVPVVEQSATAVLLFCMNTVCWEKGRMTCSHGVIEPVNLQVVQGQPKVCGQVA